MITKLIIAAVFFAILYFLGSALFYMVKNKGNSEQMLRALTFRIGMSVLLFVFLMIAVATGLIKPHGIGPDFQQKQMMHKP